MNNYLYEAKIAGGCALGERTGERERTGGGGFGGVRVHLFAHEPRREMGRCNGHGKVLVKVARLFMIALHALSRGGRARAGSGALRSSMRVKRPTRARRDTDLSPGLAC